MLKEKLEELVALVSDIRKTAGQLSPGDETNVDDAAEMVLLVDLAARELAGVKEDVQRILKYKVSSGEPIALPDYGVVVEKRVAAARRKWDTESLIPVVVEKILDSERGDDGTIDAPLSVLMSRVFDYAAVSYWRVRELRALGLVNIDDYYTDDGKRTSFAITRPFDIEKRDDDTEYF